MIQEYSVLIKRNSNNEIVSYYYPDFDFEHHCTESGSINLDEDINSILTDYIREVSISESIPFPKKLAHYKRLIPAGTWDHWGLCQINPFFIYKTEKYLPIFGVFSSLMAAITMAIINFYTTEESMNSKAGIVIGSIGSVLSAAMTLITYFFSDANQISKILGRKIDDTLLRKKTSLIKQQSDQVNNCFNAHGALKTLLALVPITTTIYSSYNHYQQVISVIENDDDGNVLTEAFIYLSLIMIFFSCYSNMVFRLSFMPPLYEKLDNCLYAVKAQSYSFRFFGQYDNRISNEDEAIELSPMNVEDVEEEVALTSDTHSLEI